VKTTVGPKALANDSACIGIWEFVFSPVQTAGSADQSDAALICIYKKSNLIKNFLFLSLFLFISPLFLLSLFRVSLNNPAFLLKVFEVSKPSKSLP